MQPSPTRAIARVPLLRKSPRAGRGRRAISGHLLPPLAGGRPGWGEAAEDHDGLRPSAASPTPTLPRRRGRESSPRRLLFIHEHALTRWRSLPRAGEWSRKHSFKARQIALRSARRSPRDGLPRISRRPRWSKSHRVSFIAPLRDRVDEILILSILIAPCDSA